MARMAPIILALIVNCCEIFVFRNIRNVVFAPHHVRLAKDIFVFGNYFLLLSTKLYPSTYRSVHWTSRYIVEFLLGLYMLETVLCDFWFPLECFAQNHIKMIPSLVKKYAPKSGPFCYITCAVVKFMQHPKTPIALSLGLSTFLTLILLHGTRAVNIGIIRTCGIKSFVLHLKDQLIKGVKKLIKPYSCFDSPRTPEELVSSR